MIRTLAERQHGVVARRQLLGLGISERVIDEWIAAGRLIKLHRGIYAVGHRVLTARGHLMAAVLALGPRAVLSHRSAASLHDLLSTSQTRAEVTVPGSRGARRRRGLRIRVTDDLHPDDVQELDGIPVTSIARTILDLASILTPIQLRRAIEQADRSGSLNLLALQRALDRRPKAKGRAKLRAILEDYAGAPPTRSMFERTFLELIETAGLPKPLVNTALEPDLMPDMYWPQWKLVVELDSRRFHSDPRTFESDRIRDARLQRLGLRVLRITWNRLKQQPHAVIDDILALARLGGGNGLGLDLALARLGGGDGLGLDLGLSRH